MTDSDAIFRRYICISGFRQDAGARSGSEKLRLKLQRFSDRNTHVSIETWDTDWDAYVSRIIRLGPRDYRLWDIRVFAYSWGVGNGLVQLARCLAREGIGIKAAVSCDGVYHSTCLPHRAISFLSPLSRRLLGEPKIVIPWNVERVWWFRQTNDRLHGHRLVAEDSVSTKLEQLGELTGGHSVADDHPRYHDLALDVAGMDL